MHILRKKMKKTKGTLTTKIWEFLLKYEASDKPSGVFGDKTNTEKMTTKTLVQNLIAIF